MSIREFKAPSETVSVMTELVLPSQTNLLGNLLGGQMMHWMDITGALTCRRHSGCEVATVTVDKIDFNQPVRVGEVITITSKLVWVGTTSMKVKIKVIAEDTKKGTFKETNIAYFTFVALDENCRPVAVPKIVPQTQKEKDAFKIEQELHDQKLKNKNGTKLLK